MGLSIKDVTALGGGGIKDFVTTVKPYYLNGGNGCQNYQKLRYIIYGQQGKTAQILGTVVCDFV
jgi:hypothetical protein